MFMLVEAFKSYCQNFDNNIQSENCNRKPLYNCYMKQMYMKNLLFGNIINRYSASIQGR